jgi:hypothetical protein
LRACISGTCAWPFPRGCVRHPRWNDQSVVAFRRVYLRNNEFDDRMIQRLVVRVCQDDLNRVPSCWKTDKDKRLAARISPVPRCVVDNNMDMPDAGRHIEGFRTKHRRDPQVLGTILGKNQTPGQWFGQGWIDGDFRRRLLRKRHDAAGPSTSLAVCAMAAVPARMAAAVTKPIDPFLMTASPRLVFIVLFPGWCDRRRMRSARVQGITLARTVWLQGHPIQALERAPDYSRSLF